MILDVLVSSFPLIHLIKFKPGLFEGEAGFGISEIVDDLLSFFLVRTSCVIERRDEGLSLSFKLDFIWLYCLDSVSEESLSATFNDCGGWNSGSSAWGMWYLTIFWAKVKMVRIINKLIYNIESSPTSYKSSFLLENLLTMDLPAITDVVYCSWKSSHYSLL